MLSMLLPYQQPCIPIKGKLKYMHMAPFSCATISLDTTIAGNLTVQTYDLPTSAAEKPACQQVVDGVSLIAFKMTL